MTDLRALTDDQLETLRTLIRRCPDLRALTVRQPWPDLIMAGVKDVENRSWPVPSRLPQWWRCPTQEARFRPGDSCDECVPDGPFPFRLGIHAAAKYDKSGNQAVMDWAHAVSDETRRRGHGPLLSGVNEMMRLQDPERRGVLLGTVEVTGCHHADECDKVDGDLITGWPSNRREPQHCSRWAEPDAYHWTLADPQPLDVPVPMSGMLGLWRLDLGEVAVDA